MTNEQLYENSLSNLWNEYATAITTSELRREQTKSNILQALDEMLARYPLPDFRGDLDKAFRAEYR